MTAIKNSFNDQWRPQYMHIVACCLLATLLTSNILAFKIVELGGFKFGTAAVFFPFSLVVGDVMTEVYGYKRSRRIILINLACFLFYSLAAHIAVILPHAQAWQNQQAYETIFGANLRVLVAGCLAYLVSELVNSRTMAHMKVVQKGKNFWLRALTSSIIGELLHSLIFVPIVFANFGVDIVLSIVFAATIVKILVQSCVLPLTYLIKNKMIALEGVDHFDEKVPELAK